MKEEKWMSEAMAVDRGIIQRAFGLADWATTFGAHAVNVKLRLIKLP